MSTILSIKSITKKFGNLIANDNISFDVKKGEVLALLGENGAGKTTLMNILFGHYTPNNGEIFFENSRVEFGNPSNAIKLGIGMVHQHFTLAENLTCIENVIIGEKSLYNFFLPKKNAQEKILNLSQKFGLPIEPNKIVGDLSVSEKQRLEILKTLYKDCKLLILDEPTASLTPQETENLFITIKNMVNRGLSVILISHKLNEILSVSNRIIVLRNGKLVGNVKTKDAKKNDLASMIVGKNIQYPTREKINLGKEYLKVRNLSYSNPLNKQEIINNVDLTIKGGEILGIAGVAGNGQRLLTKLLTGHLSPQSGKVFVKDQEIKSFTPKNFMNHHLGYIPEDRNKEALVGDMLIWENIMMTEINQKKFSNSFGIINEQKCIEESKNICSKYDIRMQSIYQHARLLSGGNVQKLIIGKWLERNPNILVACQPSRGLDEGAIAFVQKLILSVKSQGKAVLLISEDLDELINLSDNISVIFKGKISKPLKNQNLNRLDIGLMMAGEGFNV